MHYYPLPSTLLWTVCSWSDPAAHFLLYLLTSVLDPVCSYGPSLLCTASYLPAVARLIAQHILTNSQNVCKQQVLLGNADYSVRMTTLYGSKHNWLYEFENIQNSQYTNTYLKKS